MTKKWLTYMLLVLMTMQSALSMADAHQIHQSGFQHLEFDSTHRHINTKNSTSDIKHIDNKAHPDCHHCCHCHGHSVPGLLKDSPWVLSVCQLQLQSNHQNSTKSIALTELFRPPKA